MTAVTALTRESTPDHYRVRALAPDNRGQKREEVMHDERIECIVINAFDGMSDMTGSDDYGVSVAWIDLDDHMSPDGLDNYELYPHSDDVSTYVKTHPDIAGARYALALWHSTGGREAVGFSTREEMLEVFRSFESDFLAWDSEGEL